MKVLISEMKKKDFKRFYKDFEIELQHKNGNPFNPAYYELLHIGLLVCVQQPDIINALIQKDSHRAADVRTWQIKCIYGKDWDLQNTNLKKFFEALATKFVNMALLLPAGSKPLPENVMKELAFDFTVTFNRHYF